MRTLLPALVLALAACGGDGGKLPDFAAQQSICPADITTVKDGDACGSADVDCGNCTPTCAQSCIQLFCENGAWIHVQENATCDFGTNDGATSDGG